MTAAAPAEKTTECDPVVHGLAPTTAGRYALSGNFAGPIHTRWSRPPAARSGFQQTCASQNHDDGALYGSGLKYPAGPFWVRSRERFYCRGKFSPTEHARTVRDSDRQASAHQRRAALQSSRVPVLPRSSHPVLIHTGPAHSRDRPRSSVRLD